MTEEMERDAKLLTAYLEAHGPTPMTELSRELGSVVKSVVAVGEMVRRGWVRVLPQDPEVIVIEPRRRQTKRPIEDRRLAEKGKKGLVAAAR